MGTSKLVRNSREFAITVFVLTLIFSYHFEGFLPGNQNYFAISMNSYYACSQYSCFTVSTVTVFENEGVSDNTGESVFQFLVRYGCIMSGKIKRLDACYTVDLLYKLKLGCSLLTRKGRTFSYYMYITCDNVFPSVPNFLPRHLDLEVWPTFEKTCHSFLTRKGSAFIFQMCIPCGKTFHVLPSFVTSTLWPWDLSYLWKIVTLAIAS